MPAINSTFLKSFWAMLAKDALTELRTRYALSALVMFALITLTSVSMTIAGETLSPGLAAVLLWVILFFCAMAGLSRVFVQEQESGTIFALRLYGGAQAVIMGKLAFNTLMLLALTALTIPLFLVFLNVDITSWLPFILILVLGNIGIAAASTLTAAMVARAQGRSALFAVLTFPVLLPQYLSVISATAKVFDNSGPGMTDLVFMAGFDITLIIAASILFDYLWYD